MLPNFPETNEDIEMTRKAPARTLADDAEQRIFGYIQRHRLSPGDALPREDELSSMLSISRPTLREALNRLVAVGIVTSRKHHGRVISKPDIFSCARRMVSARLFNALEQKQFMELRVALELGMADYIYQRRTPEAIARLRKLAGVPGTTKQTFKTEVNFHTALMELSGNIIALQFRELVTNAFEPIYRLRLHDTPQTRVTHYDICDALEHGTVDDFIGALRGHFSHMLSMGRATEARPPAS